MGLVPLPEINQQDGKLWQINHGHPSRSCEIKGIFYNILNYWAEAIRLLAENIY